MDWMGEAETLGWIAAIFLLLILVVGLASYSSCQELPDAPRPQPQPARTCGPKWMGGCWDESKHNQPWGKTVKSWKFWGPTLAMTVLAAGDYAVTDYFSKNGHYLGNTGNGACRERNPIVGNPPSPAGYAKDFALTHAPLIVMGAMMTKAKFPHWIYDGVAVYAVQMHARGAYGWFENCR